MTWRTLGVPPLVHRKLCRDEYEVGTCFFCGGFVHKGDRYVMAVCRQHADGPMAVGICFACAQQIGEAVPEEDGDGGGAGGGDSGDPWDL